MQQTTNLPGNKPLLPDLPSSLSDLCISRSVTKTCTDDESPTAKPTVFIKRFQRTPNPQTQQGLLNPRHFIRIYSPRFSRCDAISNGHHKSLRDYVAPAELPLRHRKSHARPTPPFRPEAAKCSKAI